MPRALLAVPLATALLAWGSGLLRTGFDYDEVMQAHTIWLIAQGLVPFRDFFECHPPFAWYPFVPALALLPDGPDMLFGLRLLSALGNAAWITALFAAARAARPGLRAEWLVVAGAIAASHPMAVYLGAQFRPDAWVWAAALAALARAIRLRAGFRRAAELGAAGSLCALALPKLALLFPAYVAFDFVSRIREPLARELAGYAVGIAAGIAMAVGFLFAVGIDPRVAWDLSITYHAYVAVHYGWARGLWHEVTTDIPSLGVALVGLLASATWLRHVRQAPNPFELAVLATCALQLWLVPFPYVQYAAPIFVLSAIFAPYCGEWAAWLAARRPVAPRAILACACAIATALAVRPLVLIWRSGDAARQSDFQHAVLELAPSDARIVVPPPFHPIARRDAFYALIHTWMPSGLTSEETLRRLALPNHQRVGIAAYREQLEQSRPAVILFTTEGRETLYSPEQSAAIAGYLVEHAGDYRRADGLAPTLWVRADLAVASEPRLPPDPTPE
jgi:hypothetical protein